MVKVNSRATFITPTYENDLERFTLLRESMELCGIDIPHIAIVDHEDLELFKGVPFKHKLTLISSADVLPADIELRRTIRGYPRRHPYHWIKPEPIHGWMIQQLMKVSAPDYVNTEAILCLDSDVFFVGNVTDADFFDAGGSLHLYDQADVCTVETVGWMADSMRALNVSLRNRPTCFVHNPVPFHRDVVIEMRKCLEEVHKLRWIDVFLKYGLTEYTTYGVFAKHVYSGNKVSSIRPPFTLNYWLPEDVKDLESKLITQIGECNARIVLINSNIGLSAESYRGVVERAWHEMGLK